MRPARDAANLSAQPAELSNELVAELDQKLEEKYYASGEIIAEEGCPGQLFGILAEVSRPVVSCSKLARRSLRDMPRRHLPTSHRREESK